MEQYRKYWSLLHSVAYRMTGSMQDAEDIVQDLFADLQEKSIGQINKPYLIKSVTNRCINFLQSARKKREVYVGEWLPEPSVKLPDQNPAELVEKKKRYPTLFWWR